MIGLELISEQFLQVKLKHGKYSGIQRINGIFIKHMKRSSFRDSKPDYTKQY